MDKRKEQQTNFLGIIFKLMDRGLTGEEIDWAMKQVVGPDWREVPVDTWFSRLHDRNYVKDVPEDQYVDQLEALILGCIKLNRISRGV